MVIVTGM